MIYLCSANDTADRQCLPAPPASLFLSLMLPRKGQPFPPERRNCSHTFRGVLQFRLPSAPQRYNTLDFPGKVVCHETAGFFGFFRSKGSSIPSEHPRQRRTLFPFESPCQQGCYSPLLETQSQRGCAPLDTLYIFFACAYIKRQSYFAPYLAYIFHILRKQKIPQTSSLMEE